MIEHDVDNDRTEQRESERNEARTDEQTQSANDLETGDHVDVTAIDERGGECAGVSWRHRRRRNEMQEAVGTENDEDESEQDAGSVDGVFHKS